MAYKYNTSILFCSICEEEKMWVEGFKRNDRSDLNLVIVLIVHIKS